MSDRRRSLRDHVLTTVRFMAANPKANDGELVDGLCCKGYEELQAELHMVLVPLGLARAVIRRLPQPDPVELSDHAVILRDGRELILPLMLVPEFVEAERLGEETFTTGIIPREDFSKVAPRSVELILVNNMLFAESTSGIIAPPFLLRLGDVAAFEDWYSGIVGDFANEE